MNDPSTARSLPGMIVGLALVAGVACAPHEPATLTRRTLEGKPEGGFGPEQRLPLRAVVDAWTAEPAWASFEEAREGLLAPGLLADLVVLSKDIFKERADTAKDFEVVTTILDGQVVYRRDR